MVQYGPICRVVKRALTCAIRDVHDFPGGSVQLLVPVPDTAAPTRTHSGAILARFRSGRAPLREFAYSAEACMIF